ncbi:OmpP1/FadL family transporter [Pseudodesulfovibrio sediminis]|uniref:OmpP1/FadL/TodX family outer membrane transporter n=1 Tax=Pseudodesulfovibrio sediminis TaxID=2810563 RepID=A0ABN6ERH7_9BACT|nr:outer membrane protein transport protein [Pseudodesulfovibrio sediminis]BCS87719.1 OmpP1/FadL/TodX family outer membrane transporter [Pseudodesulfovibrio sediminis]
MKRASIVFIFSLFVCLLTSVTTVQAGGFSLYEWSNKSVGMGTVGYAIALDPSVIATNPALMTDLEGSQAMAGAVFIAPRTDITINGETESLKSNTFMVPHAYFTHQLNDVAWFGIGMFTRFGLGIEYNDDFMAGWEAQKVKLTTTSINPSVAFQLTDELSVGGGVELVLGDFEHEFIRGAGFKIDAEGYAFSGNLGAKYQFTDELSAGLSARLPLSFHGNGNVTGGANGDIDVYADLPASITLGLGFQPTEDWTFEFDVVHTRWDSLKTLDYEGTINSKSKFYYKNTWRLQAGAEYAALDWLDLRAGVVWDQTPIRQEHASVLLPSNDRLMFSTGLGFHGEQWFVDTSFMYIMVRDRYGVNVETSPAGAVANADFTGGTTYVGGVNAGFTF